MTDFAVNVLCFPALSVPLLKSEEIYHFVSS